MAARSGPGRLLERTRVKLVQQMDINKVLPRLLRRGIFSVSEEKEILAPSTPQQRTGVLLDILATKNDKTYFLEFCKTLEECSPHLLTFFVLDGQELNSEAVSAADEKPPPTQALQLGFELALKERDAVLRENAKAQEELDQAGRQLEQMRNERDQALDQLQTRHRKSAKDKGTTSTDPSTTRLHRTPSQKMAAEKDKPLVIESDQAYEENGANVVWETHQVVLRKAPTFGFGIAVSGGRDSPHFANGDPSVAISDVLTAGPAEGKLQINDRILTVNGVSLENVNHNTAITVLRDSGSSVSMVVKRRVLLPAYSVERNNLPSKIILNKKSKRDEFGLVLGVKFYVKEIAPHSLAAHERALREGDTVLKINNTPVEGLSLVDVRKILDKGKDKLQLLINRDVSSRGDEQQPAAAMAMATQQPLNNSQGELPPPASREDVNIYRPSVRSEEEIYTKDPTSIRRPVPPGAYPASQNTRYDGHYVLDNDLPHPRVPPPNAQGPDDKDIYPARRIDTRDNFYADWNDIAPQDRMEPYSLVRPDAGYDEDVFSSPQSIHDLEPRRVNFAKDRQTGLGLRLAGGNATGIFIASVQPGSNAERQNLVEGDNILMANEREITGLTREEAVAYLTSLEGNVSMVVQYRKEDYDTIMASHEAGDSFYIRTHFNHQAADTATEHSFRVGDIFLVKDTLFRGVGGSWLAVHVTDDVSENKKGTIPNSKTAEILKSQHKGEGEKDPFPNRGKGSLFKRKSARRSKSLGKDHWEEVVFAGLETKFPAYERIVQQEPGFVRPIVIFGAISDIARERLLAEYPDRFEAPQMDKSADGKNKSAIIRLGAIRDAIASRKHCLLDVTPANVDRLNYAQYCPVVIYLKADSKQAVKDVRSRWKTANKNLKKLQEYNDKLERCYANLFTGVIQHMGTDAWFPRLVEMVDNQQQQRVWMSEKSPLEDINDEFMFPMSTRLSYAAGADSDFELPRPKDDFDLYAGTKKSLMVRSSSDPSINTQEHIPGIPPYPSPPTYKNQRIPSHDSRISGSDAGHGFPPREDEFMHPEDRYYPSYYTDRAIDSRYAASRAHIDPYATLTPSERLRPRMQPDHFQGSYDQLQYGPYRDRIEEGGGHHQFAPNMSPDGRGGNPPYTPPSSSSHPPSNSTHLPGDQKGYADNSSHSSDSYSKYVNSPQNKHDDTKLREKFGTMPSMGSVDKGKGGHDPYRFTRSTTNPINVATVDKAKLSDLTAKYRSKQENGNTSSSSNSQGPKPSPSKPPGGSQTSKAPPPVPIKKKEPPPVPVKNYSLKQRGVEPDELKMRNYENSNRSYNYADVNKSSAIAASAAATPPLPPPPSSASIAEYSPYHQQSTSHSDHDRPYEYISVRQAQINKNNDSNNNAGLSHNAQQQQQQQLHSQLFKGSPSSNFNNQPLPPSSAAAAATTSLPSSSSSFASHPYPPPQQHQQQKHNSFSSPGRPTVSGNSGGLGYDGGNIPSYPGPPPPPLPAQQAAGHDPYDSKSFANEVYMYQGDVSRTRSSYDLRDGEMVAGLMDGGRDDYMGEKGYRRPRTDDEQLQELQYSRDRARSESRLTEMSRHPPQQHQQQQPWGGVSDPSGPYYDGSRGNSNMGGVPRGRIGRDPYRYKSLDHEPSSPGIAGSAGFTAYQKLITAGSFTAKRSSLAHSVIELRSRDANQDSFHQQENHHPQQQQQQQQQQKYGSAFNAYRKPNSNTLTFDLRDPRSTMDGSTSNMSRPGPSNRQQGGVNPGSELRQSNFKAFANATDENHTVIATAKEMFTSKGGLLESPETGVSINIPEGAIEDGKEQEIYFKVCRDNNILPPLDTEKGETLLSPLVMCGPHGVNFLKPVELRLPHSASANPESWSFALKSSDAPSGETTEWQNMTLAGSEGTAKGKVNQDSVSIQVDHF